MAAAAHLWRFARLALLSSLSFGDAGVEPSGAKLEFDYGGCERVRPGPVCELGSNREIVVWAAGAEPIEVGGVATHSNEVHETAQVEGGTRVRVLVAKGERALRLRSGDKRAMLPVREGSEATALRELDQLWKAGNWEQVRARLVRTNTPLPPAESGRLRAFRARLAFRAGQNEHAADELEATSESALRAGLLLEAGNDLAAAAYGRAVRLGQYERARKLLADAHELEVVPENRARFAYYSAVVANAAGDLLAALAQFRRASVLARRLELVSDELLARQELAVTLNQLHRHEEALAEQRQLVRADFGAPTCLVSQRWEKLAWFLLTQPQPDLNEAAVALDRAEALLVHCPDPSSIRNHALNRVELALQLRDIANARARLEALEGDMSGWSTRLAAWQARYWGELQSLEGAHAEAIPWFERAEQLAESLDLKNLVYLSRLGRARALAAQSHTALNDAIAAYQAAEDAADALVRWVPFGQGQQLTAVQTQQGSRELLSLFLTGGRNEDAMQAASRATRRLSTSERQNTRVLSFGPAARRRWELAVAEYRARRQEIETAATNDWKLSLDGLRALQLSRALEKQQLDNALARANALVREALPRPAPSNDDDAHLLIAGASDGWWAFLRSGEGLHVARVAPFTSGAGALQEFGTALGGVLEGFLLQLNVPLLRVTLPPELAALDVHALEVAGEPLIERLAVAYALDPDSRADRDMVSPSSAGSVLVVGNPSRDLPRAEAEARDVAARFAGAQLFLHEGLTPDALIPAFRNARLLHFAGHGRSGGIDGTEGALQLGSRRVLSLGDVLALQHVPDFVVLSTCSSSVSPEAGSGLSIGQAFVLVGAKAVVGASRAVSDRASERFARALYDRLMSSPTSGTDGLPTDSRAWAGAVRAATLELKRSDGTDDWASVRLLLP